MTYQECQQNIADTINLLDSLGFIIHPDKSKFIPSKEVTCFGFIINSETMTVKLTAEEKLTIKEVKAQLLLKITRYDMLQRLLGCYLQVFLQ